MTNYSRSVLLSNGFPYSKIRLKKFDFSPIDAPANIAKKLPSQRCSQPLLIPIFNFSHKWPTFAFTGESGYTHSAFGERSHTRAHTAKHGAFRMGGCYHYPLERSACFGNPAWSGGRTANFAAFGSWLRGAPEERREPRNSDALMRVAVPRRRGPAGLRDLFRFCRNYGFHTLCSGLSACARHGRYHYPRRALRVAETPGPRLSKRLTCRFLRLGSLH